MAISWGSWDYPSSGGNGMRVGIDFISWVDNATNGAITHSTTTAKATVDIYTENTFAYDDPQVLTYGGSISGTTSYNNTSAGNGAAVKRATKTFTVPYTTYASSPGTRTVTATVSGAFNGVTPTKSSTLTIPARPATSPSAPSISSTPNNGSITVTYGAPMTDGGTNPSTSDDGVDISYYQYSTNDAFWVTTPSNPFTYPSDNSAANGTPITIYVRAVNTAGIGGFSASTANTPRTTPGTPTSFAGNNTTFGQISLSWVAPASDGGSGITSYTLRNGSTVLQNTTATSYVHTGLTPYTDYSYTVTAVNVAGESSIAASVTVKTMGGIAKVWNGSAWINVLPKVWNGSAWVDAQARMWNGTEWKHGI